MRVAGDAMDPRKHFLSGDLSLPLMAGDDVVDEGECECGSA